MESPEEETGPINLGNPVEIPIAELAERIVEMVGAGGSIERQPLPADDPMQRCPDITRAKAALDWTPSVDLATGLARTIAYFKETL